jgi:hypothetical protein
MIGSIYKKKYTKHTKDSGKKNSYTQLIVHYGENKSWSHAIKKNNANLPMPL